jgi:hypothetical protein
MKKLLLFSILILFVGLSLNYFKSNAQDTDLVPVPCGNPNSPPCPEPTPQVVSVIFEQINSPIDGNPNMGNGRRIFPDKESPTDAVNRKVIKVKAMLNGLPSPGSKVRFKVFDVDDPDTNTVIDSNGVIGDDNRGSPKPGTLSGDLMMPGTSDFIDIGTAEIEVAAYLTVTMQPGDNFVVAASADPSYFGSITVDGTGLKHSVDGTLPTAKAKRTEMLTVWRRLHMEVDSMGVVIDNKVEGNLTETKKVSIGNQTLNLSVNNLEPNRFEKGRLIIKRGVTLIADRKVIALNTTTNANTVNSVTINNNLGLFVIKAGDSFTLYDDDDYNGNNTMLIGDEGEFVSQFSESFKHLQSTDGNYSDNTPQNILGDAYIRPIRTWALQYDNNMPFDLNVEDSEASANLNTSLINANRGSKNDEDDDFWISYIIIGYQPGLTKDFDNGLTESPTVGVTPAFTCDCLVNSTCPRMANSNLCSGIVPKGGQGSIVLVETSKDYRTAWLNPPLPYMPKVFNEAETTVPHELGHQLGLLGDQISTDFKIMDYQDPISSSGNVEVKFNSQHINILRSRIKSPGK